MAKRNREVGSPQPQKFLPDIEGVAMLRRKTPGRRNTFDIGQQQDPAAIGNNSSNSSIPKVGTAKAGNPSGMFPVTGTPSAGRPNRVATRIDSATTASPTGLPGRNRSPSSKSRIAATPIASTIQWMPPS